MHLGMVAEFQHDGTKGNIYVDAKLSSKYVTRSTVMLIE